LFHVAHKGNSGSTFGERFSFARWYQSGHVRHETDNQFAEAVGRDKSTVSQWRKAKEPPPREITVAIAERTGVEAAWLLALPGSSAPLGFEGWLAVYRKSAAPVSKKGRRTG
jgi:transcriptional regulator with XRE-family HTH domain